MIQNLKAIIKNLTKLLSKINKKNKKAHKDLLKYKCYKKIILKNIKK